MYELLCRPENMLVACIINKRKIFKKPSAKTFGLFNLKCESTSHPDSATFIFIFLKSIYLPLKTSSGSSDAFSPLGMTFKSSLM